MVYHVFAAMPKPTMPPDLHFSDICCVAYPFLFTTALFLQVNIFGWYCESFYTILPFHFAVAGALVWWAAGKRPPIYKPTFREFFLANYRDFPYSKVISFLWYWFMVFYRKVLTPAFLYPLRRRHRPSADGAVVMMEEGTSPAVEA